jgi:hypothetical protein
MANSKTTSVKAIRFIFLPLIQVDKMGEIITITRPG